MLRLVVETSRVSSTWEHDASWVYPHSSQQVCQCTSKPRRFPPITLCLLEIAQTVLLWSHIIAIGRIIDPDSVNNILVPVTACPFITYHMHAATAAAAASGPVADTATLPALLRRMDTQWGTAMTYHLQVPHGQTFAPRGFFIAPLYSNRMVCRSR